MNTVVKLPNKKEHIIYEGDDIFTGIQIELNKYLQNGGTLKELVRRCGGRPSLQTISNIYYGKTKSPRTITLILLFDALGFTLQAIR